MDESDEANVSTRFLIVKKDHKKAQGYEPHDLRANDSGEGNKQGYSLIMKKWDQDQNAGTAGKCLELNIEHIKVMPHRYSYYIHAKASDDIRGGSISTTQYCTIPQASLHQKKSLWLSH